MSDKRFAAIFLLHMPSWIPAWMLSQPPDPREGAGWILLQFLLPALACSLIAFCFTIQETQDYVGRVRKGSQEPITRVAAIWLFGIPMFWVVMNFAAM